MQCKEWDDENSELFKESHDEAVHKNSYKSRLYELISASLMRPEKMNPEASCPVPMIPYTGPAFCMFFPFSLMI